METVELNCEKRDTHTRGQIRELRRNGRTPAIIYGPRIAATSIVVSTHDLKDRVASSSRQRVIRFRSPESALDSKHVIIKHIQRAAISGEIIHADFYEVNLQEKVRVEVPLKFVGRPKGVADGGILQPLVRQLEVESLPLEIPESIEVDVSELGIHDVIHVSALKVPGNVKPIYDQDFGVVSVLPPTVEEAPVAAVAEEAAVPAEGAEGAPGAAAPGAAPAAEAGKEAAAGEKPAAGRKGEGGRK